MISTSGDSENDRLPKDWPDETTGATNSSQNLRGNLEMACNRQGISKIAWVA
jgi:hypothetical protein